MNTGPSPLNAREKEVIDLLLHGKSNKEMALALGVSVSTVEFHLRNVYRKLGVRSRTAVILQLRAATGGDGSGGLGLSVGGPDGKPLESIVDPVDRCRHTAVRKQSAPQGPPSNL